VDYFIVLALMEGGHGMPRGGLFSLMMEGEGSQLTQEVEQSRESLKREWTNDVLKALVDMCEEKYWEFNRKPFRERNWKDFAEKLSTRFPTEVQRSWKQVRDKWNKMKDKFTQEKKKIGQTGSAPSDWTPWYEIFDNMYGGTARINGLPQGVDQGVRTEHEEVEILSDDEVLVAPTATPLSPRSKACQNPQAPDQVNKSANKRKRKVSAGDSAIADAIKYGFDGVQESEKMKM
jgi:hypothetical protein